MDKSRQQFESRFNKWYACSKLDEKLIKAIENVLWDVWQASRESLEAELPERKNYSGFQQFDNGYERAIDDCENILISKGVKIKNE